ncbi:peptidase M16 [Halomonas sp. MCCC 1A17488]|uniref:insulinase family protein n=1 Tax=unclassified Halomonas TaxID=2609666 RepID=UPI0018D22944|nr:MULTISPECIES: insulinase family protein [unclassified Halomonas]MCE8016812.1 peptidase M16 [Halomonas sp. MCCC 1A17488]MCG3240145.1 peptidase M16 [Halomonas sp. MCCC 1A17488]QPP49975.1 insulinase family protein [Halomonas sp. SS10-MC5]
MMPTPRPPLPRPGRRHSLPWLAYLLLAGLLLSGLAQAKQPGDIAAEEAVEEVVLPHVSPHDSRDYRVLRLDNGLTALLVSDPEADRAAASLNVGVGSAQDPDDLAGLAHFLEHMLFLGTEPFPEADAYQGYLQRHGGSHNAFTAPQDTNYFFDIEPEALPGALDRFSEFFLTPLFNPSRLESERNIVHSEYMARIRDDGRRENDVLNQVLNAANPTTGFSVGSRETLADRPEGEPSLRERVIEFYERYYDANVMHLALVAPQPLDELEAMVAERFADIADRGLERPVIEEPLVREGSLPRYVELQSVRDSRQVSFMFPVPDPIQHYRHKPADLLAHLLGHEGEGSLFAVLREAGLADGLSAGVGRGDERHALFTVSISLTPAGAERIDEIEATLFAAIEAIRENGLEAWRYAEQARLAEQEFRFQQHGSTLQSAMRLAMNLARFPMEDVQYAAYRMDGFEPELIEPYLEALRPERLLRVYSGPDVEGERTSPWFDTPWREIEPGAATTRPLAGLALPAPNPFIAEDVTLLDEQDERPSQLLEAPGFELWHMADASFDTPKVEWRFSLQNPAASSDPRHAVLANLLAGWLEDSLNEEFYAARLAGHDAEAYAHARGITLAFSGWRDRQDRVMRRTLEQLLEGDIDEASFERVRYRLQREWRNAPQAALFRQGHRTLAEALMRPHWPTQSLLDASRELTVDDLRDFRKRFLGELRLQALAIGNLDAELARREGQLVAEMLAPSLPREAIPDLTPLRIDDELPILRPVTTREESLVLRYLQGSNRSLDAQARLSVLGQVIDTPFYQRLRTEEQLGYVVSAGYSPLLDAPGLSLLVQSPDATSDEIQAHIDAFLESFGRRLAEMDDDDLAPYRQAVHDGLLQRDTSLSERTNRLWRALSFGDTEFDRRERLAQRVLAVTAEDLRETWPTLLDTAIATIAYDPGDEPSDVAALTRHLEPMPEAAD